MLFVDLPSSYSREKILKIHLLNENPEPDVDISSIALAMNCYSGSNLKNLCVAAVLAYVREEIKVAMNRAGISDITTDVSRFKDIGHALPEKLISMKIHLLNHLYTLGTMSGVEVLRSRSSSVVLTLTPNKHRPFLLPEYITVPHQV